MTKELIREKINLTRKNLSKEIIAEKSKKIIESLIKLEEYNNASTIMPYISLNIEVDTKEFIKKELLKGKNIVVPFVEDENIQISRLNNFENLVQGKFGVLEPEKKERYDGKIDLVIIPGIAFDEKGSRIGFGKGYYDKFLERFKDSLKIGLAFEEQIVDFVPSEEHDQPVDIIITEKRVIKCNY
ncbi:5-formyltetrahydrofolate cyclo-ligase [Candidatus Woesearchaeota archaeon]|nr:5-formyltetrahydrofolate cyclo-ligase [Candidatus Woesearchaeota archaeon]